MNAAAAADLLMNKEGGDLAYINRIQSYQQKTEREKQEQAKRLPENGAEINAGNAVAKVRLIDCVGFPVEGSAGFEEEDGPRLVKTPWGKIYVYREYGKLVEHPFEYAREALFIGGFRIQ